MSDSAIATIVKMMETLPDPLQEEVVEQVRGYLDDLKDEALWDKQFAGTQDSLAADAERVRRESAAGLAEPMDLNKL